MSDAPAQAVNPIVESAIGRIGEIATLPEVTVKIIQIVEDPKATAKDLHSIIKHDPALSAKILKVVNSAFYGLPGQIASIDRAIVLLGLSAIKNISIAMSMTRMFRAGKSVEGIDGMEVYKHSLAVAAACRILTKMQGRPSLEESFLAGLLHDLGLLVERQAFPQQTQEIVNRFKAAPKNFCQIENEVIGANHQLFGQALAAKWRFPRVLRTAIGYHHNPMELAAEHRELAALVCAADILAGRCNIGFCATTFGEQISDDVLAAISLERGDVEAVSEQIPAEVAQIEAVFSG